MKRALSVLTLLCLLPPVYGQTAYWIVKPSVYNEISYIAPNTYKVIKNGKIGLINGEGTVVAEATNDGLSGFFNNIALLTSSDNGKEKVTGTLNKNGLFYKFSNNAYTLYGQAFYSDGLLSVSLDNGSLGYVDEKGTIVLDFNDKYDRIKPFTEGHAAVFKNKKYSLIDKTGAATQLMFSGVGEVYGGTNAFNGIVYVWDTTGKFYIYDIIAGGNCKKVKAPNDINAVDYLYRFSSITGMPKQPVFSAPSAPNDSDLDFPTVNESTEGKGYSYKGQTVLPVQFTAASPFLSGSAAVIKNGRCGLLGFVADDKFEVSTGTSQIRYYAGKTAKCSLNLHIPKVWESKELKMDILREDGQLLQSCDAATSVTFEEALPITGDKTYKIQITGEGLLLLDTNVTQSYKAIEICTTCKQDKDKCPYKGKHPATHSGNKNEEKKKNDTPVNDWY